MDKSVIIFQVMTLILLMAVGFAAQKLKYLNAEVVKGLTAILVNISAPALAISAFHFSYSQQLLVEAAQVFVFAVAVHLGTILLGKLLYRKMPERTVKVLSFATVFSNCAFMGYPVVASIFGERGVFFAAVYVAVFNIIMWTYGVIIFTGKTERGAWRKALLNPGVIAVWIGMALFLFSIKLPVPLAQAIQNLGSMTTPISMILVGSMLTEIRLPDLFNGVELYYGTAVRLLGIPLGVMAILKWIGLQGIVLGVCTLTVAMPVAAMSVPLAEQNNGDAVLASRLVFLSTLLSIVTIPLVIWML